MHFEVLQAISLNGDVRKPNDDRSGCTAERAWIVDGATDLGAPGLLGPQGGASWLASTASAAFTRVIGSDIRQVCRSVFSEIEETFERDRTRDVTAAWEVPKAAFCAAQLSGQALSVAWAADSPILRISESDVTWCTGTPDTTAEAQDARALGSGTGAATALSGAALADRRARRAQAGHAALSTDAEASMAITQFADVPIASGDALLLMSDGFASLVTDYSAYSAKALADALPRKGLAALAQEIRTIETEDAACLRYPRFKVSDDATALWLRIAG